MSALAHEVRQAKAAIEDAVGAEMDVGREGSLLGNRLLRAYPREQRRQGSSADDAISGTLRRPGNRRPSSMMSPVQIVMVGFEFSS